MNKQEHAYASIRERVLSGAYGPGYRLVIDSLASELGVSAVPVREAIRRLEAEGLVLHRANVGARVTPVDPQEFEDRMIVLAVLEGYATALAAPLLDSGDLALLETRTDEMVACLDELDALGFGRANHEFHRAIYARCPNPYLVETLHDTGSRLDAIRRTVFLQIAFRGWASVSEHRKLIELIATKAPFEAIETAAREHKLRTVEAFRRRAASHEGDVSTYAGADLADVREGDA